MNTFTTSTGHHHEDDDPTRLGDLRAQIASAAHQVGFKLIKHPLSLSSWLTPEQMTVDELATIRDNAAVLEHALRNGLAVTYDQGLPSLLVLQEVTR